MVRKKTKTSRKKCAPCRKPTGLVGSVVSWVREKAGMPSQCSCN